MDKPKDTKSNQWMFALSGILLISMSYIIIVFNPVDMIVKDKLSLYKGSFLYNLWEKPPIDIFIKVYVFNVTNSEAFLNGTDKKLKLQEVGPYVYQEFLENKNATFHPNGTLSYYPTRRIVPILEMSIGDLNKDVIVVPNVPLLGITSAAADLSMWAELALSTLTKSLNCQPFLNLTVYDYLWGYEDKLVSLASTFVPNLINFKKFGLLDRMLDDGENLVSINLPSRNFDEPDIDDEPYSEFLKTESKIEETEHFVSKREIEAFEPTVKDYSINTWNGSPGLKHWGYDDKDNSRSRECNTLRGAYDGTIFPKNITETEIFNVYRKAFCRTLPIKYSHAGRLNGLEAYWFTLAADAFDNDIDDTKSSCYCTDNKCLRKGLGNITPCYYNIPVAVSLPHFYKSDPSLLNEIDGMRPDQTKHDLEIILQPQLGVPMRAHSRMQLNLLVGKSKFNSDIKPFEDTVIPIVWLEISVEKLTPYLLFLLNLLFNVAPYAQLGFVIIAFIAGISFFAVAALAHFCVPKLSHDFNPKKDIKYSAINMFPFIKRELLEQLGEETVTPAQPEIV